MEETEIKQKLLNVKPADTIVLLRRRGSSYPWRLSKETDTTYSHMVRMLQELESCGLVENEERGRKKIYRLTPKGKRLGDKLSGLREVSGIEFSSTRREERSEQKPTLRDSLRESYA